MEIIFWYGIAVEIGICKCIGARTYFKKMSVILHFYWFTNNNFTIVYFPKARCIYFSIASRAGTLAPGTDKNVKFTPVIQLLPYLFKFGTSTSASKSFFNKPQLFSKLKVEASQGNSQEKSKIVLLMWGITRITYIMIFFFLSCRSCFPILFSYKYGSSSLFFINICC